MRRDVEKGDLPPNPDARLYYRAREVAALTGLSLRTIYAGIYAAWIPSRKVGNSRLIPAAWLHALTDREAETIARNFPSYQYTLGTRPRCHEAECAWCNAKLRRALHLRQRHSYVFVTGVH